MPQGKKTKVDRDEWKRVISQAGGVVTIVAQKLGISRQTVLRVRNNVPWIQEAFQQATAIATDMAETVILEELRNGNPKVAMWFLERKAKDRGYGREMKIESESKLANITVYIPDNGRSQPVLEEK
jgi:hypothetical protein